MTGMVPIIVVLLVAGADLALNIVTVKAASISEIQVSKVSKFYFFSLYLSVFILLIANTKIHDVK